MAYSFFLFLTVGYHPLITFPRNKFLQLHTIPHSHVPHVMPKGVELVTLKIRTKSGQLPYLCMLKYRLFKQICLKQSRCKQILPQIEYLTSLIQSNKEHLSKLSSGKSRPNKFVIKCLLTLEIYVYKKLPFNQFLKE